MTKMTNSRGLTKLKPVGVEWTDNDIFGVKSGHNIYKSVLLSNNIADVNFVDKNAAALRPSAMICGALDMCKSWPVPREGQVGYVENNRGLFSRGHSAINSVCYDDSLICYGRGREDSLESGEVLSVQNRETSARSSVDYALSEEQDLIMVSPKRSCFDTIKKVLACFTEICARFTSK